MAKISRIHLTWINSKIQEGVLSAEMHTSSRNILKVVSSLMKAGEVWPWGQAMSQVLSPESQLLRLG